MDLFYKILLFVLLIVYGMIRFPFAKKCKNKKNTKFLHKKLEILNVFIAWLGMVLVPMIYVFTSILNRFQIQIPASIRVLAVLGLVIDCIFFYIVHKTLDDNWSAILEVKEGQKVVKNGVYKHIRHPMYTQCWIWVLLQGVVAANIFVEVFGIFTWGFLYFIRVFTEEKMMKENFGQEYEEYMKQTGRILPKFW